MSIANRRFYTIVDLEKYKTDFLSNNQILSTQIAGGNSDDPLIDITDAFNNSDTQKPVYSATVNLSQENPDVLGLRGYGYLNRDGTTGVVQNTILKNGLTLTGRDINFVGSGKNSYNYKYDISTRSDRVFFYTYSIWSPYGYNVNSAGSEKTIFPHNTGSPNSIQHGDDIDAGKASQNQGPTYNVYNQLVAIDHREPIKSNNVTGFRINYNYDKQTGVIQTGNDIGDLITPSHSYTQGVSGTDNTNQKKRQIWYRTGSLYGHLRGSQGGGSGAGGARTQGQEQRSGGKGGNGGPTLHAGFIYPEVPNDSGNAKRLTEINFQAGAGGYGGWGGKAGGSGQDGTPGGTSQQTILDFNPDGQGLQLTIHGTGGGSTGEGGEKGDQTSNGIDAGSVLNYPASKTTDGYTWVPPSRWYPTAAGGPRNKNEAGGASGIPGINGTFRSYVLMGSRQLHLKQGG